MAGRIRKRLTFANVTAAIALFVALGGTGYAALTLPRDSVGKAQIRDRAVGKSELRTNSVGSRVLRDSAVRLENISSGAQDALRGQQGPPGAPYLAAVTSGGSAVKGNSRLVEHVSGSNAYRVTFDRDATNCVATATLAAIQNGPTLEEPDAGRITVGPSAGSILVKTFAANGAPAERPFNVTLSC